MNPYFGSVSIRTTIVIVALLACTFATSAGGIGVRLGNDLGGSAWQWEQRLGPKTAAIIATGADRAYMGRSLRLAGRSYWRNDRRGPYVQVAGTLAQGWSEHALWSAVQLSGVGGFSWPILRSGRASVEIGHSAQTIGARDVEGHHVIHRNKQWVLGLTFTWFFNE